MIKRYALLLTFVTHLCCAMQVDTLEPGGNGDGDSFGNNYPYEQLVEDFKNAIANLDLVII